jgi:hypothetical protein
LLSNNCDDPLKLYLISASFFIKRSFYFFIGYVRGHCFFSTMLNGAEGARLLRESREKENSAGYKAPRRLPDNLQKRRASRCAINRQV